MEVPFVSNYITRYNGVRQMPGMLALNKFVRFK
jgi:hypothetical protein